jgi:hypothetical protein
MAGLRLSESTVERTTEAAGERLGALWDGGHPLGTTADWRFGAGTATREAGRSPPSASTPRGSASRARSVTARSPSTAITPSAPSPGRWPPGCTCPRTGPTTPTAGRKPRCPRRFPSGPSPRSPWGSRTKPGPGGPPRLCGRRRRLRRQPQLPGRVGAAPAAVRGGRPCRLRRGVGSHGPGSTGGCSAGRPAALGLADRALVPGQPGLAAGPVRDRALLASDVGGPASAGLTDRGAAGAGSSREAEVSLE